MPYHEGPQARHTGQFVQTLRSDTGEEQTIGFVYDPSGVAPATVDREFGEKLAEVYQKWRVNAEGVMAGVAEPWPNWDKWEPWDAVLLMVASHPGDILPMPGLYPDPPPDPRGWWYESAEEKRKREKQDAARAKGAYIAESIARGRPDWAVDGEGGDR